MRFASGWMLLLIALIPLALLVIRRQGKKREGALAYSWTNLLGPPPASRRVFLSRWLPHALRTASLVLLVLGLARPQSGQTSEEIHSKGTDIILCLDTSGSMRAEDFKPDNRLAVAKRVAADFIKGRKHDRIGVVVFGGLSFTQCPLTTDDEAVLDLLDHVEIGITQTENTAVGSGIATGVNRLKDSEAKSKIIILVTDGRNNAGEVDPLTAAKAAAALDIKIYTIGIGSVGEAPFPVQDPIFGKRYVMIREDLDDVTLTKVAEAASGQYFRATTPEALKRIYQQIDKMEKTDFKITEYTNYTDLYFPYVLAALLLLLGEVGLSHTALQRIP